MIEGWMVTMLIAVITVVSGYAVTRSNVAKSNKEISLINEQNVVFLEFMNSKIPLMNHLSKKENLIDAKVDSMGKEIVELRTQLAQVPTMKDVRKEFVSKEVFLQMEKHIDGKFDGLQATLSKVLENQERIIRDN